MERNLTPNDPAYWDEANIKLVLRELKDHFGFPVEPWNEKLNGYCLENKIEDRMEGFIKLGTEVINPILNNILCRKSGYPTFQKFFEFVVKKGWR